MEVGEGGWEQATWAELPHSHGSRGPEYAPLEEGSGEPLPLGNTSVRAAFVHVLGDLLQSLGVLIASILIYFKVPCVQACPVFPSPLYIPALPSLGPHPNPTPPPCSIGSLAQGYGPFPLSGPVCPGCP